jgi:hypothetical protein
MSTVAFLRLEHKAEVEEKATLLLETLNAIVMMGDSPYDVARVLNGSLAFVMVTAGHPEIARSLDNFFHSLEKPETTEEEWNKVEKRLGFVVSSVIELDELVSSKSEQKIAERACVLMNTLGSVLYNVIQKLWGTAAAKNFHEAFKTATDQSVVKAMNDIPGTDTVN